ncbi:MAG: DegT/DnrJ/EryC1/StrS family aminotransferase [Lentisphaerae bacterium]|mgnify:CR=1 FL=1|jgi:dTDP-4-amino-4,6-dideoxygalactose transaminase|nr:DegT/DnrJ/EryC1/StrS family aminotransferase [Lentisphaerota bacterium]MBT4817485.1 DegT/DnrJ/EryC1/StrS family aminotransferase [Lentisphaerota bacterium]MBT5612732.1 DegT/DnrJ/EryC1/StrS family aminotransferase [Lentisphaerota bacterium]MBT7058961.1 DegT/DnrJ/EryC1/StrS family aminotransferase [Lentisphaerota bacterium]MBT7848381.1 DegT/DnrJ/EryC1/StrS family aminotransferase [Lentisphaerota bacterium]
MAELAINGGPKAVTNQLGGWPVFSEEGIKDVEAVLRSGKVNYWTGPKGMEFEKRFAEWQGSKYAISVNSGTAALHVGLTALGIGPGDEVIVPSYTFIASSFSIVQAGAIPRFADVNRDDHCISISSAEKLVNERTKAIMVVHLYGNVADMDEVQAFADKHGLYVIEDNAEAFGGEYKGRKTGTLGAIAGCSFCQNKTFTTGGEGGMVTTDDEDLAWKARSFRDHGYDVQARLGLLELEQKLPYIHNVVGWNYRMTEMQSAIGLSELDRMESWNMPNRRRNCRIIMDKLAGVPQVLHAPIDTDDRRNGFYVMAFSLDIDNMSCDINTFVETATAEGAPVWKVFWPQCHTEKAFQNHNAFGNSGFPFDSDNYTTPASADYSDVAVPNAVWHQDHTFTCFAFPTCTAEDCEQIGDAIVKVIKAYS